MFPPPDHLPLNFSFLRCTKPLSHFAYIVRLNYLLVIFSSLGCRTLAALDSLLCRPLCFAYVVRYLRYNCTLMLLVYNSLNIPYHSSQISADLELLVNHDLECTKSSPCVYPLSPYTLNTYQITRLSLMLTLYPNIKNIT